MDLLDLKILKCLKDNARKTASVISKDIGLSVSAVIERIRKMEEKEIIKEYTIIVNQSKIGNDVTALMEVCLEHPQYYDSFVEEVKRNTNIVDCYYLTGDFDFILKICCRSSEHLEQIHREIKSVNGVSATRTHFVLKEIKDIYSVIPKEADMVIPNSSNK